MIDTGALRERFTRAVLSGDVAQMMALLTDDVKLLSDGGGKKPAAINPLAGADTVARFLTGIARKRTEEPKVVPAVINGLLGFLIIGRDGIDSAWAFETRGGRITAIYISRNPDKLGTIAATTGLPIN